MRWLRGRHVWGRMLVVGLVGLGAGLLPNTMVQAGEATVTNFDSAQDMTNVGDESDLFLYNVFVTGNHSADTADTEGGMAIQGDSLIPQKAVKGQDGNFDYGGIFGAVSNAVGEPLNARNKISLLIRGQIRNYSAGGARVIGVPGERGWLVTAADQPYWFDRPNIEAQAGVKLMTPAQISKTFTQLTKQRDAIAQRLSHYTAATDDAGAVKAVHYTAEPSRADPHVYVVAVEPAAGSDTVQMPQVDDLDKLIDDPQTKQIIFTTSATKVVFEQPALYHGVPVNINDPSSGLAAKVAERTVFYMPNATQVTNYSKAGAAPDIHPGGTPPNADVPVDAQGHDLYNAAYFQPYTSPATAVAGSIIAPLATIVWRSGNLNGYVFAKALHQRAGAEAHNFYNPWVSSVSLKLTKNWADDHNRAGVRPSQLRFDVFAGQDLVRTVTMKIDANDQQILTVPGLPKFAADGSEIQYRVEERLPENSPYTSQESADGLTFTNTYHARPKPGKVTYQVIKHWLDYGAANRPGQLPVQLYQGDPRCPLAEAKPVGQPVTLTAARNWRFQWTGLPKLTSEGGKQGQYFAREIKTSPNYAATWADAAERTTLTNTYRPLGWHLRLRKLAAGTKTPLPGATFRLNRRVVNGKVPEAGSQTATTDKHGELHFSQALSFKPEAVYYLQETKAPTGYQLDPHVTRLQITGKDAAGTQHLNDDGNGTLTYTVTVDGQPQSLDDIDTLTLTRTNRPQSVLPHTGGSGLRPVRRLAAWCFGIAAVMALISLLSREEAARHD